MNENDKKGKGTLSDICQEWEKACEEIKKRGKDGKYQDSNCIRQ